MPQKKKSKAKTSAIAGRVQNAQGKFVFAPGVSGNPAGKVPGTKNFTTIIRDALVKISQAKDKDGLPMTYEQTLVKTVLKKAIVDEDVAMIKLIWNYLDGYPVQPLDPVRPFNESLDAETKSKIDKIFERNMRRPK